VDVIVLDFPQENDDEIKKPPCSDITINPENRYTLKLENKSTRTNKLCSNGENKHK